MTGQETIQYVPLKSLHLSFNFKEFVNNLNTWSFKLLKLGTSTTANSGDLLRTNVYKFGEQRYPGTERHNVEKKLEQGEYTTSWSNILSADGVCISLKISSPLSLYYQETGVHISKENTVSRRCRVARHKYTSSQIPKYGTPNMQDQMMSLLQLNLRLRRQKFVCTQNNACHVILDRTYAGKLQLHNL